MRSFEQTNPSAMIILFPGRHQLLTRFQFEYLSGLVRDGLRQATDLSGKPLAIQEPVEAIVFAVTSANHSNTRRNPVPFYLRALALQEFAHDLGVPAYIYGIDDVGNLDNFASYTLKRIRHDSEGTLDLTPDNTLVLCSTPVLNMYEQLGFRILPAELLDRTTWRHRAALPWDLVTAVADRKDWDQDAAITQQIHPASIALFKKYKLDQKIQLLFRDKMIGDDGDITGTRDYNTYVRQMDTIAGLKYEETAPYLRPGRIGDIGCAVGSWIRLACQDVRFRESDFYGVEVARHLFEICQQRKHNGEFVNPFVFFAQRNAVTGLAFDRDSMNTVHTSSLTHEIESYGSRAELLQFIANRYTELAHGGIWVNRDVVGPANRDQEVYMTLQHRDGQHDDVYQEGLSREALATYLNGLSTYGRFLRFARDFRRKEGYQLRYRLEMRDGEYGVLLSLGDACEFMSRKDYTDNWESEMHETFTFWDFNDWQQHLEAVGFRVLPESKAYTNTWIVTNRLAGKVRLYQQVAGRWEEMPYPVTNMIMLAEKP